MTPVTIALNLGNFASLTALAPTKQMIADFGLVPRWCALRPANRPVTPPPEPDDPLAEYKARRKAARDGWAANEFRRDCERLGLEPESTPSGLDATAANLHLQFLADRGDDPLPFIESVLYRGFVDGQALADVDDIMGLIDARVRDESAAFVKNEGDRRLQEIENELAEALVYAGPAYLIGEEAFIGRQHFPLMRWLLAGGEGTPPV